MNEEELRVNELVKAYRENDVKKIDKMNDVDLNYQYEFGETPLMMAIRNQEETLVIKLINAGVNLDIKDCQGSAAIHESIGISGFGSARSLTITNLLIEKGVNLNIQDNKGNTPLLESIFYKNKTLTKLLIDSGADLNIQNTNGNTALFKLIYQGDHVNAKKVINKHGVDLNHRDDLGNTALIASIAAEPLDDDKSRELTVLLLNKGVDINTQQRSTGIPLF